MTNKPEFELKYKVKRHIATPLLKKETGVPIFVIFLSAIEISSVEKNGIAGRDDGTQEEPASVAQVIDLSTGEAMTLICNKVIEGELNENYPDNSYVNRAFRIVQLPKRDGKRYFDYTIAEIDIDVDQVADSENAEMIANAIDSEPF